MNSQTIHPKDWRKFFDVFTELNRDSLVSLEFMPRGEGVKKELVRDVPLEAMVFNGENDPCNNIVLVHFPEVEGRKFTHEIVDPFDIRLRQTDDGQKWLEISAENGITYLDFHSGQLLDLVGAQIETAPV